MDHFADQHASTPLLCARLPAEVPLVSLEAAPSGSGDLSVHAEFSGRVEFFNKFKGNLPAAEYPKLNFYFAMTIAYIVSWSASKTCSVPGDPRLGRASTSTNVSHPSSRS